MIESIDWNLVVLKIKQKKSLCQAAREIGVDQNVLHRYSSGVNTTEPKFSVGLKLLDLYHDLFNGDMGGICQK